MGQLLRAMTYDRSTEDATEALSIAGTPLVWVHLDDGVMGGKSITTLSVTDSGSLFFQGTIDSNASVGWTSARARLPSLAPTTTGLKVTTLGDGKTYKVVVMDANHEKNTSPLWESNLPTRNGVVETTVLPFQNFTPSYMGRPANNGQATLDPASLTKIGFMLSSRLSDGSQNPVETYGEGTFRFSLRVDALEAVMDKKQ